MTTRTVFGRPRSNRVTAAVVAAIVVFVVLVGGAVWLVNGRTSHPNGSAPPTTTTPTATPPLQPDPLAPKTGIRLGAWAGSADQTQQGRITAFTTLQDDLGVDLSIVHVYRKLDDPIGVQSDTQFIAEGKTLLISWRGTDTKQMAAGAVDSVIAQRAREVAALKVPVFFQFRWEMDRPNLDGVVHSPADYIAAWKRVRMVFAAQHVTNAQFVWCPLATGFALNRAQAYYPGDDSVDWICADLYPPINAAPVSFAKLAEPFLAWADQHPKPIMFGEFGVPKGYGSARADWLAGIKTVLTQNPKIKALVYFNADDVGKYLISDDTPALAALATLGREFGVKSLR